MMTGFSGGEPTLLMNFRAAVNEALILSGLAGLLVSILVSLIISRKVIGPVHEMMLASQRISEGHYHERVHFPGEDGTGEEDELGQLARSFNKMTTQLEQIEAMRVQMIGDVAHEMRTPLTVIKGSMEGLLDGVLPAEAETFQQIHNEADRLECLVNDLQELSRVEAGAFELHMEDVSITKLIETLTSRLKGQFDEKNVSFESKTHDGGTVLKVDEKRISQILLNLAGNALRYTPAGGKVSLNVTCSNGLTRFEISDTGIGIGVEHLSRIFDRFYRVDKSRSRAGGGSGIGLTISKKLVEAHGGKIWAESPGYGMGSTFIFTLPTST